MTIVSYFASPEPPRSPHVPRPNFWTSYFPSSSSSSTSSTSGAMNVPRPASSSLRPSRRDLLLCLITLSFSYLLFSPPSDLIEVVRDSPGHSHDPVPGVGLGGAGGYASKLPGWNALFGEDKKVACAGEESVTEGLKPIGFAAKAEAAAAIEGGGKNRWDEEEEAEADELGLVETALLGHQAGWTMMDRCYAYNGSIYVITERRDDWPDLIRMTSTGLPANGEPGNGEARKPKGHEIVFVTPAEALEMWGDRVYRIAGTTWMINDGQYLDHYYHFAAEWFMGAWRTYASLDPKIGPTGETTLPPPKRFWFLHLTSMQWRDGPRFNSALLNAVLPSISFLYPEDWDDLRKQSTANEAIAYQFDRVVYSDRSAAFYGYYTEKTSRTVAAALHIGDAGRWWWEPIRRAVLRYSGVSEEIINRNREGIGSVDPLDVAADVNGAASLVPEVPAGVMSYTPTVLYISRQGSRRRLRQPDHDALVAELEARQSEVGYELIVVEAERLSKQEQWALAGKATIMLGVHGNGLTHLIWMPSTPRSAVIEMFFVGGFARDYQWTAQALGMKHFGINHDKIIAAPDLPEVEYPEGFHGTEITVDAKTVADLIQDRLEGRI